MAPWQRPTRARALCCFFLTVLVLTVADTSNTTKTVGTAIFINGNTTVLTIRGEHGYVVSITVTSTPFMGRSSIHWDSFQLQQVADVLPSMAGSSAQAGAVPILSDNEDDAMTPEHLRAFEAFLEEVLPEHKIMAYRQQEDERVHRGATRRSYEEDLQEKIKLLAEEYGIDMPLSPPTAVARTHNAARDGVDNLRSSLAHVRVGGPARITFRDGVNLPQSDAGPSGHDRERVAARIGGPSNVELRSDEVHIPRRYAGPAAVARAHTVEEDGLHIPRRYAGPAAVARAHTVEEDGLHIPRRYARPAAVARAHTVEEDGLHIPRRYAGPAAVARAHTVEEDGLHIPRRYARPAAVARAHIVEEDGLHIPRRYAGRSAVARAHTAAEDGFDSRARGTGRPSDLAVFMAGGIVSSYDEEEGVDHLHIDSAEEDVVGPSVMLGGHVPSPSVDPIRIMDGMDIHNPEDTFDRLNRWAVAVVACAARR